MHSNNRFAGFNSHPKLEGTHAFLSPSTPTWLRYTPEKLIERLSSAKAAALGTELHETAARNIRRRIKLMSHPDWPVLANYVNDAIDFGMTPEQMLFFSFNCYGTADTISFEPYSNDDRFAGFLRIHDLKTGVTKASEDQLYVYAAIFCLEYDIKPFTMDGELRIYQGNKVYECPIDRAYLAYVYDSIRSSDEIIEQHGSGELI